ncbi:MAG: hypothetical protein WC222_01850 [Parachlamydiales bacterium]|jgi:hypothetical protein
MAVRGLLSSIRLLSKFHLIVKIAIFSIFFGKFFYQSEFRKKSIVIILVCFFSAGLYGKTTLPNHDEILPYLLPNDHPIKASLDSFFSKKRVIFNRKTLEDAGFANTTPRQFTSLIVTTHPNYPGCIFKLYLDVQRYHHRTSELYLWLLRVEGAEKVRHVIAEHHLDSFLKVPKKWIYFLPDQAKIPDGYYPRHYILIEEDMELVSNTENRTYWSSEKVTPSLLNAVYLVLSEVGLSDCAKIDNIPVSKDGKIAFIDTQTHGKGKVPFHRLNKALSSGNRAYWKYISEQ